MKIKARAAKVCMLSLQEAKHVQTQLLDVGADRLALLSMA